MFMLLGYVDPRYGLTGLEANYDHELTKYNKTNIKILCKT